MSSANPKKELIKQKVLEIAIDRWSPRFDESGDFKSTFITLTDPGMGVEMSKDPTLPFGDIRIALTPGAGRHSIHPNKPRTEFSYSQQDKEDLEALYQRLYTIHDIDGHKEKRRQALLEEQQQKKREEDEKSAKELKELEELF